MNAALTERLVYVARAARDAGHGKRGAIYDAACAELGISRATLLRKLKEVSVTDKRKKRADAGRSALTRDEAALISATLREATRKNGKRLYSIADAVETLRSNGFITAGRTDEATGEFFPLSEDTISLARSMMSVGRPSLAEMAKALDLPGNSLTHRPRRPRWPACIPITSGRLMPHFVRFTT